MVSLISSQRTQTEEIEQDLIPLMEGMKELRQGDQVIGPSTDGDGSDYASFTDDSNEEESTNESDSNSTVIVPP
jgi:hypothetical protein